jgi:hypothetical protein
MSYLDSLEDNLKNLESREDTAQRDKEDRQRRDVEWARAQAAAPYAEQLRSGPFTQALLNEATRIGHSQRTKVHIAWMDAILRLEARDRKLELRPTGAGVVAVFFENKQEVRTEPVDLAGDASQLAERWLAPPA